MSLKQYAIQHNGNGQDDPKDNIRVKGYETLQRCLDRAYTRSAHGKGKERHADGNTFENQPIIAIPRLLAGHPAAAPLYQAVKKIQESRRMKKEAMLNELADAMVYISAAMLFIEEVVLDEDGGAK